MRGGSVGGLIRLPYSSVDDWLKAGILKADNVVVLATLGHGKEQVGHSSDKDKEYMIDAERMMAVLHIVK